MGRISKGIRFLIVGALILAAVLVSVACKSGYGATTSTTPSTVSSGNAVTISNFAFSPTTLTVKVGTTVTWTNKDSTTHTITSDSGAFDSGSVSPNGNFSHAFSSAGTFGYHCSIHTYMTGTIVVQ